MIVMQDGVIRIIGETWLHIKNASSMDAGDDMLGLHFMEWKNALWVIKVGKTRFLYKKLEKEKYWNWQSIGRIKRYTWRKNVKEMQVDKKGNLTKITNKIIPNGDIWNEIAPHIEKGIVHYTKILNEINHWNIAIKEQELREIILTNKEAMNTLFVDYNTDWVHDNKYKYEEMTGYIHELLSAGEKGDGIIYITLKRERSIFYYSIVRWKKDNEEIYCLFARY